jgi:hypothetical protein
MVASSRRKVADNIAPYFGWTEAERDATALPLCGVRLGATHTRLENWLRENRALWPKPSPPRSLEPKIAAVKKAIIEIRRCQNMWSPERYAAIRWSQALTRIKKQLAPLQALADVRQGEHLFHMGHSVGALRDRQRDRAGRTGEIKASLGLLIEGSRRLDAVLETEYADAMSPFGDWRLPRPDALKKPQKAKLAQVVCILGEGGFTNREIAELIDDGTPMGLKKVERLKKLRTRSADRVR